MKKRKAMLFIIALSTLLVFAGLNLGENEPQTIENTEIGESTSQVENQQVAIDASRAYYLVDEVALYIHTFGELPRNYLTKKEAIELGWDSDKGNLWLVTDQMVIGGDVFGNREGLLPKATGRTWYECDVNYTGGYRSSMRIVYSNDGLIYYTEDHYESFEKLYD